MDEHPEAYLKRMEVAPAHANYERMLAIMQGYGDNRWWLSDGPKVRAYYQTEVLVSSGILFLANLGSYQKDLFALLNRHVYGVEMDEDRVQKLWQEVQNVARRDLGM